MTESTVDHRTPSATRLLVRGLLRRCPRCGSGRLFRHWTQMVSDCPRCGYHFEREEGFFLGAFVVNVIITQAMIIAVIAVGFAVTAPDPPVLRLAVIGVVFGALTPVVSYPFTKTTWTAVDMIMRKSMGENYATSQQPAFRARTGRSSAARERDRDRPDQR
jgi:uncharacterized protein (DUF983 family)